MNAPRDIAAAPALMEAYFHDLAAILDRALVAGEAYMAWFSSEASDFVRMNRGKVRQPGTVAQRYLEIELIRDKRHASHRVSLTGNLADDREALHAIVAALRGIVPDMDEDPHLLVATDVVPTRSVRGEPLPPVEAIIDSIVGAASGLDLVGIYAGGPIHRGFANALGQRNWHEATTFNLQWSVYHRDDKAVKSTLSGFAWDERALVSKMNEARAQLGHVAMPPKTLDPGKYRAYLTPAAMEEIAGLLCWGGFSARALETKQSSLSRMREGARLDQRLTVAEATADGVAPAFQGEGFVRPPRVALIENGELVGSLVSPRTAREFSLAANGANGGEGPESLAIDGGTLDASEALAALDTGLFVGNLHYLNYSDRPACRMTGMTRFATFWVENGRVVAPVNVLRFDDTIYRILGSNLEALTKETELILESGTYFERALASMRLPGALVSEIEFTL